MKRPAVFFDRDNTLIVGNGYIGDPAAVKLVPGAAAAVARARRLGFVTVVVSNQSGVARGMFDETAVHAVNQRLEQLLLADDPAAVIDRHEFCPFHPEANVPAYRQDSALRKPKPGMILQAADMLALDLSRSWMVGDAPRDIAAGRAAGCRTVLFTAPDLEASPAAEAAVDDSEPDYSADTLEEALNVIDRNRDRETESETSSQRAFTTTLVGAAERDDRSDERTTVQTAKTTRADPVLPNLNAAPPPIRASAANPVANSANSANSANDSSSVVTHEARRPHPPAPRATPTNPATPDSSTTHRPGTARSEALLEQILIELRRRGTVEDDDFSVSKLLAGIVQVLAIGLLFIAYLRRDEESFAALLLVSQFLQTLVIALLIMGRQR